MKINIKIIQYGSIISFVSFLFALLLGVYKDSTQLIGYFTISTYQNAAFSVFGSCFFAVITAFVAYENEKLKYIENTEKFLINVLLNCRMMFAHIHEANGILEQQILSKENKKAITLISTFETRFEAELNNLRLLELPFFSQKSVFGLYNILVTQDYDLLKEVIFEIKKIKILCTDWEIHNNEQTIVQACKKCSDLHEAKKRDLETELKEKIVRISWKVNHINEQCTLAIILIYYLTKRKDKLEKVLDIINKQAEGYCQSYKVSPPNLDNRLISDHLLKLIHLLAEIESLLTNSNHPVLIKLVFDRYAFLVALSEKYNELRCFRYEVDILFAHDEKMKFYLIKLIESMALYLEEFKSVIDNPVRNFTSLEQFLTQNNITFLNYSQAENAEKLNQFLIEHCNCSYLFNLCQKLLEIINNDDFRSRLNLYKQD